MKYQLHDYEIDSVLLDSDAIIFSFPNGFYAVDDNGQKLEPPRTKLAFIVDRGQGSHEPLESFIFIRRLKRGGTGWKEISFKQFTSLFKKGNMVIYDEFDSKLANRKILQLNACISWSNIEMLIEDVVNVVCLS